jgi:hypothetical protein
MSTYVRLSVMYDPNRARWEAWDSAVLPRIYGLGTTPEEALFSLEEELHKLRLGAPDWVKTPQERKH